MHKNIHKKASVIIATICLLACSAHAMENGDARGQALEREQELAAAVNSPIFGPVFEPILGPVLGPILGDEIIDADEWLYQNYLEKKAQAEKKQKELDTKQEKLDKDFLTACLCDETVDILQLLDDGANPNTFTRNSGAAFFRCAHLQNKVAVEAFLKKGIDVPLLERVHGSTLIATNTFHDLTITQKLIDGGANINKQSAFGTAIHHAIRYGFADMVELLIKAGADLTQKDIDRRTPLQLAHSWLSLSLRDGNSPEHHSSEYLARLRRIVCLLGGDPRDSYYDHSRILAQWQLVEKRCQREESKE